MRESARRRTFGFWAAALLVIALWGAAGATAALSQPGGKSISTELRELWRAEVAHREKVSAQDKAELVTAAKKGFKPERDASSVNLRLSLKSPVVRVGEALSYSLSIENRGPAVVRIYDRRAFFKRPRITSSIEWQFWLTTPSGEKIRLVYGDTAELAARRVGRLPQTPQEEAKSGATLAAGDMERAAWEAEAENTLDIRLGPGEILKSRGCAQSDPQVKRVGPGFCDYPSDQMPQIPGRYALTVVMLDFPPPLGEGEQMKNPRFAAEFHRQHQHHLGRRESNSVVFDLMP